MILVELILSVLQAAYVHDLSPFAIRFGEFFGIRWYGLSYLAGFVLAYFIIGWLSRHRKVTLQPHQVSDFVFYAAVGAILGGRLGYCLFYDQSLLTKVTSSFPFWGVLEVHKGGMASHGGILGVFFACMIFAKREALPKLELLDLVALTACLGIMFGRFANFVNGELVGRPSDESYSMAVKFPQDLYAWPYHERARLGELAPAAYALGFSTEEFQTALNSNDARFFDSLVAKVVESIQSGDTTLRDSVSPLLTPRHPSQLYEAFLEGLFLFILIALAWRLWPRPGIPSSTFLVIYPVVRIIGEQFRLPDAQIGFELWGLTRGQWISAAMLLLGFAYAFVVLRAPHNQRVSP